MTNKGHPESIPLNRSPIVLISYGPEERGSPRDEGDRARCDAPSCQPGVSGVE